MENVRRAYFAEFLGTFALVFIGTAVATLHSFLDYGDAGTPMVAAAFGGTLAVLVVAIGPASGCHVNPAVTIALALAGRLRPGLVPGYVVAQILGAVAASGVLWSLMTGIPGYSLAEHGLGANGNPQELSLSSLAGLEMLMTALFVFVIFSATRGESASTAQALAIGGFLFLAHLVGVPLGDSSLNPARSIGPAIFVRGEALSVLWVYVAAPIAGGIIGWLGGKIVYGD